jgi:hypothetical protein
LGRARARWDAAEPNKQVRIQGNRITLREPDIGASGVYAADGAIDPEIARSRYLEFCPRRNLKREEPQLQEMRLLSEAGSNNRPRKTEHASSRAEDTWRLLKQSSRYLFRWDDITTSVAWKGRRFRSCLTNPVALGRKESRI